MRFKYVTDMLDLLYPRLCVACDYREAASEGIFCINCAADMPWTLHAQTPCNLVEQQFWGRVPIERCVAALYFIPEGKTQRLLHNLKYRGQKEIGECIGKYFGMELRTAGQFGGIQAVVPVPLHPGKQKKRGYNQSEVFAKGLARALDAELVNNALARIKNSISQTTQSRQDRMHNVAEAFCVTRRLSGHILLVDDVTTTGATLESCARALQHLAGVRVSFATMACGRV